MAAEVGIEVGAVDVDFATDLGEGDDSLVAVVLPCFGRDSKQLSRASDSSHSASRSEALRFSIISARRSSLSWSDCHSSCGIMTIVMGEIVDGCELLLIRIYVSAVETANFNFFSSKKQTEEKVAGVSRFGIQHKKGRCLVLKERSCPSLNFCRNAKIISGGADLQKFALLGRTKYSYGRIWPQETANVQPIFYR